MQTENDLYAFENYPRDPIQFKMSRRDFWSVLVGNVSVLRDKGRGIAAFNLSELGSFSDEQLAGLMPMIAQGSQISVQDGMVWGQAPTASTKIALFPQDSPALIAFNLFNGATALKQISQQLSDKTGWDAARSFAYTRGLFLTLVKACLCHPSAKL